MPQPYATVLIGDLEGSRERDPETRRVVQATFERLLAELNQELGLAGLATPLVLTAGDEFQAVFHRPAAIVKVIQEMTDGLYTHPHLMDREDPAAGRRSHRRSTKRWAPLRQGIAFGVARGSITTGPLPTAGNQAPTPARMDGPAFHRARDAITRAKSERRWACFEGFHPVDGAALEALFALMGAIRVGWSTNQWVTCNAVRHAEYQKDAAESLQVSPSVVSESLKAADYRTIRHGEDAARDLLANLRTTLEEGGAE